MAGWKFWEWETEAEKHERDAIDFTRQAQQMVRDTNAETFLNDAANWVGSGINKVKEAAQGSLQGSQESYFNLAKRVGTPDAAATGLSTAAAGIEPLVDPSGLAAGTMERLGVPGAEETGMRKDVLDVLGAASPGIGALSAAGLKTGINVDLGPREVLSAPLSLTNPLGKVAKAFGEGFRGAEQAGKVVSNVVDAVTPAGKYSSYLKDVKDGMDFLMQTPVQRKPFPDEAVPEIVNSVKTLLDETGGATYNVFTGDKLKAPEYAVGIFPEKSRIIEGLADEQDIKEFILDNKNILSDPRTNIGLWHDGDKTYLDVSVTVPEKGMAEELGRKFNQIAIYDLKHQQEVMINDTVAGQSKLTLIHSSRQPNLEMVDPAFQGTGQIGAEKNRLFKDPLHPATSELNEGQTRYTNWYVAKPGADIEPRFLGGHWYKTEEELGPGGLINAVDRAGRTNEELKAAGYKGVYFPDHDQVQLWEPVAAERLGQAVTPDIAKGLLEAGTKGLGKSAIKGGVAGGVSAFDPEEFQQDPIGTSFRVIEGAGLGAAEAAVAKKAVTDLNMAGVDSSIISAFNRKLIENAPKTIAKSPNSILGLMYSSMLSGAATFAGQALALGPEVAGRFSRDILGTAVRHSPSDLVGDVMGLSEGMFVGSRAFADGMIHVLDNGLFDAPSRAINAIDMWSRAVMYGMHVGYEAAKDASKAGMTFNARYKYIQDSLADPVAHGYHDDALASALRATYVGEMGATGKMFQGIQEHPIGQVVLPFVGTVHRMASRAVEFSPLGALGTGVDVARGVYSPGRETIGKAFGDIQNVTPLAERVGNNVVGSAFYFYFFDQARRGNITAYGPDDQSTRDSMIRQGWQPFSIKAGDKWIDYRRLGPVAQLLAMAATPAEQQLYNKEGDTGDHIAAGIRAYVALGDEMTYIRGITELARVFQFGDPENYLESSVRRLVPYGALLSTIATGMDPKMRDASGMKEELISMIPGLRQTLPERTDIYNTPRDNPKYGIASIVPTRISEEKINTVDSELQRFDLPAGRTPERITDENGQEIRLSDQQKRDFVQVAGTGKRLALGAIVDTKMYQDADDETKKKMLATVTRHAAQWGREAVVPGSVKDAELARYGGDPEKAAAGLVKAMTTQQNLEALKGRKYAGYTQEQAKEIDDWKSSLAALRQAYGNAIGDQAFIREYGYKGYVRAKNVEVSSGYSRARERMIRANPEYNVFYGAALDPNEVQSAKTLIPT